MAFKKIVDYTKEELDDAVKNAVSYCTDKSLDFYKILNGVDAYFERRQRKDLENARKRAGIPTQEELRQSHPLED